MAFPLGTITDVAGIEVGHVERVGRGWQTGTTVVLARRGAVAGVDVRGAGPGTRETDALRPGNLVSAIHAVCLTGGSAYGLAAADGVVRRMEEIGLGFPVGIAGADGTVAHVVPVVPAAVIFDLGRGGRVDRRPDAEFGYLAARRATARQQRYGSVGAGAGAVSGGLQGGVGTASRRVVLADGTVATVGALAVVNSNGTVIDGASGLPWELDGFDERRPRAACRAAIRAAIDARRGGAPLNTTIGVVATDAVLDSAHVTRLATIGHDGLARAIRPAHAMVDGDTVFALATGCVALPAPAALDVLLEAAAGVFAQACVHAVLAARSHRGGPPSYRDVAGT